MRFHVMALAVFALVSFSGSAHGAWVRILEVQSPAQGLFEVEQTVRTDRLQVEKVGPECRFARLTYTAVGRNAFYPYNDLYLNLALERQSGNTAVYRVLPQGTIYKFLVQNAGANADCTYVFSAWE